MLDLRSNKLRAAGAEALAEVLPAGLQHLDLSGNYLFAAGAEAWEILLSSWGQIAESRKSIFRVCHGPCQGYA